MNSVERDDRRRLRRIEVTAGLFGMLLLFGTNRTARRVTDLPADAKVAFFHVDAERDVIIAFIHSAEFAIVPEGAAPPLLDVVYETVRDDERTRTTIGVS